MDLVIINTLLGTTYTVDPVSVVAKAIMELSFEEDNRFDRRHHELHFDKTGETLGCGCTFCMTLHSYTLTSKAIHRLDKRLHNDNYVFISNEEEQYSWDRLKKLKRAKVDLKERKDYLKLKLEL